MKNKMKLVYDLIEAYYCGEKRKPSDVVKGLGITVLEWIPQTLFDQIWITAENNDIDLPPFIRRIPNSEKKQSVEFDMKDAISIGYVNEKFFYTNKNTREKEGWKVFGVILKG